ncbi:MAG: MAPEG family protein [Burkholderiales bacterium]
MSVPITALYAGLCGLVLLALAARVIRLRWSLRVGTGDGGDRALNRAIRVHGNAAEYVPIALVLLLVAEIDRASPALLHACGGVLVAARLLHAIGLSRTTGVSWQRMAGTTGTAAVIAVLAVGGIVEYFA